MTTSTWWSAGYPAQYYARSNTDVIINGFPAVAWVDVSLYSAAPSWLPVASDMIAMTAAEWEARPVGVQCYIDSGKWVTYSPAVTLVQKAQSALATARAYVNQNYLMLSATIPDAWVTYQKALIAIANGTDTTSTTLPTAPSQ